MMKELEFIYEYVGLDEYEMEKHFQIIIFSLWDHWLTRQEYDDCFPVPNSETCRLESQKFIDATLQVFRDEKILTFDGKRIRKNLKEISLDELPVVYDGNIEYDPFFIPRLQMIYEIGDDFCIFIYCKSEADISEKLEILQRFGLKRIIVKV